MNSKNKRGVAIAALITVAVTLTGCKSFDGRVDSSITGEYSNESEIKAQARTVEADIIVRAEAHEASLVNLQSQLDALYASVEAELAEIGAENIKRNSILQRGLGITSGLIDTFIPQAKPITDGLFPLATDLLLLGGMGAGVGTWQRRRGVRDGAGAVAAGVKRAADKDPTFADAILSGQAGKELGNQFEYAPKPVRQAINDNRVS